MKHTYFISDAHLGSRAIPNSREQEKHLCRFLDEIKTQAESIYILGDLFDFWFEYKNVVPKGYTRLLGKLSELTDMGIAVHFFTGNHDIWCKDYLTKECGIIMHYSPETINIKGKNFFMAHGAPSSITDFANGHSVGCILTSEWPLVWNGPSTAD